MSTPLEEPRVEDLYPVRSRVSWGACLAGAVIALALYLVLTLFGGAIGLSLSDANIRAGTLAWTAAIAAVFAIVVSLFVGGLVTTQLAVGENKREAIIHGVLMWGVVLAAVFSLAFLGVRTGFGALMATAYAAPSDGWEELARRAGVPQARIDEMRAEQERLRERIAEAAEDPTAPQRLASTAAAAAWWTLAGTLLSIAAAVSGALLGSGPTFQLVALRTTGRLRVQRTETVAPR
jgi:hypothetical protein